MKKKLSLICVLFLLLSCFAKEKNNFLGSGETFHLSVATESIILGSGISLLATDFLCSDILKLNRINLPSSFDKNSVLAIDRPFMNQYSKKIDTVATVIQFGALLSPVILMTTNNSEWFTIGTMYAESVIWAYGLKELGKLIVNRARPYMYFENYPEDKLDDWANSFPSGHTTLSFAGASFTSYVFSKYFPDSKWKWVVSGSSFAIATTTGILRLLSGNHFLTDVISGAVIGTLCGFSIPFFHTIFPKKQNENVQILASPASFSINIKL